MNVKATILASTLLLFISRASVLNTAPGIVEQGDRLSFSIPVNNAADVDLINVRILIVSKPAWLEISTNSLLGPITLPPYEAMTYRLDFDAISVPEQVAGIVAEILTDTPDLHAAHYVWHFRTSNAFLTFRSECLDEEGGRLGEVFPQIYCPL